MSGSAVLGSGPKVQGFVMLWLKLALGVGLGAALAAARGNNGGGGAAAVGNMVWSSAELRSDHAALLPTVLGIPMLFHRSHRFTRAQLEGHHTTTIRTAEEQRRLRRTARNVRSCTTANAGSLTVYSDDSALEATMAELLREVDGARRERFTAAWRKLHARRSPLSDVFVLRSDWFRLASVWMHGGWWIDADAACIDSFDDALGTEAVAAELSAARVTAASPAAPRHCRRRQASPRPLVTRRCVFAWEGDVASTRSAPLNWAFGCSARHAFLLGVMDALVARINAWSATAPAGSPPHRDAFAAQASTSRGAAVDIPVLSLTGPALVGDALEAYLNGDFHRTPYALRGDAMLARSSSSSNGEEEDGTVASSSYAYGLIEPLLEAGVAGARVHGIAVGILDALGLGSGGVDGAAEPRCSLAELRSSRGEVADNATTWRRATIVRPARRALEEEGGGEEEVEVEVEEEEEVVVLPYCMLRSRGCSHLAGLPWEDKVAVHHEFDTVWRVSFWHNYYETSSDEEEGFRGSHGVGRSGAVAEEL